MFWQPLKPLAGAMHIYLIYITKSIADFKSEVRAKFLVTVDSFLINVHVCLLQSPAKKDHNPIL